MVNLKVASLKVTLENVWDTSSANRYEDNLDIRKLQIKIKLIEKSKIYEIQRLKSLK